MFVHTINTVHNTVCCSDDNHSNQSVRRLQLHMCFSAGHHRAIESWCPICTSIGGPACVLYMCWRLQISPTSFACMYVWKNASLNVPSFVWNCLWPVTFVWCGVCCVPEALSTFERLSTYSRFQDACFIVEKQKCKLTNHMQAISIHPEYSKSDCFLCVCFRDETSNLKLTVCLWKGHTTYGSRARILHMRTQQNMTCPLHIVRGPGGSTSGARKWTTRPWHLLHSCVTLASSRGEALGPPRYPDNLACIVVLASVGNAPSNASLTANGSFNWKALPARLHGGAPRGSWEVTSHRIDKIQDD